MALTLGKSLAEIDAMPSTEVTEWLAYFAVIPMPEPWLLNARLCHTIWRAHGGKGKLTDWIPRAQSAKQSTQEMQWRMKTLARRHNRMLEQQPK